MTGLTKKERARRAEEKARYDANFAEIFGERSAEPRSPSRTRMVWDADYEMLIDVEKRDMYRANMFDEMRSDLACPMIAPAFPEHRNMHTGEMVTDRARHREILKRHGLEEVGNTAPGSLGTPEWKKERDHAKSVENDLAEVWRAAKDGQLENMRNRLAEQDMKKPKDDLGPVAAPAVKDNADYVRL